MSRAPRLSAHASLRHHLDGTTSRFVLHYDENSEPAVVAPMVADALLLCDGTREVPEIVETLNARGHHVLTSALVHLFEEYGRHGIIEAGTPREPWPVPELPLQRPLEVAPGVAMACDGSGTCCQRFASVVFNDEERARATRLLPDLITEASFTPDSGATSSYAAAALIDGACVFLQGGRCAIHAAGGARAKPMPCQTFPLVLVDDGTAVRVSMSVECACVQRSLLAPEAPPLVTASARVLGDLRERPLLSELPAELVVASTEKPVSRDRVRAWCLARLERRPTGDVAASLWALGNALERDGLEARWAERRVDLTQLPESVAHLAAAARELEGHLAGHRSPRDRVLSDVAAIAETAERFESPRPAPDPRLEMRYLELNLWAYRWAWPLPMADAMRDLAMRLWIARDLRLQNALAVTEATWRGYGLWRWVLAR